MALESVAAVRGEVIAMMAWLQQWGVVGLAVMYTLEAMAVPFPIEIPLIISGFLLVSGAHGFLLLLLITWGATTLGNLLTFWIARTRLRTLWLRISRRFLDPALVQRADRMVHRYGVGAVVFTRWINWGFGLTLWMTGLSSAPARRFVPAVLINNLLWAAFWVWLGGMLARGMVAFRLPWWAVLIVPAVFLSVTLLVNYLRQRQPRPTGG